MTVSRNKVFRSMFTIALATAILFAFTLLNDEPVENKTAAVEAQSVVPYFSAEKNMKTEIRLLFYPSEGEPGGFVLVEAGPLSPDETPELSFDFPGSSTGFYQAGGLSYALLAIDCDATPGTYSVEIKTGNGEDSNAAGTELILTEREYSLSRFSMPADRTAGWTADRLAEDREKVRLARENTASEPLWEGEFIMPVEARISSQYGAIRIINDNPPRRHSGLDLAAPGGTPVAATNSGIVRLAEFLLSGGNTVIIDHGLDLSSTYMHLDKIYVKQGQQVIAGDIIGTVGMTGYATGDHLHWEVNIGQQAVDPEKLFSPAFDWLPPAYVFRLSPVQQ